MSMQPMVRSVMVSLRLAQALRQLRDCEIEDARRYREMRDRAEESRTFLDGRLKRAVAAARKCNRRLVQTQRKLRLTLEGGQALDSMRVIAGRAS